MQRSHVLMLLVLLCKICQQLDPNTLCSSLICISFLPSIEVKFEVKFEPVQNRLSRQLCPWSDQVISSIELTASEIWQAFYITAQLVCNEIGALWWRCNTTQ